MKMGGAAGHFSEQRRRTVVALTPLIPLSYCNPECNRASQQEEAVITISEGTSNMEEYVIDFPGGARVDAHFGPYIVKTDQPPSGGGEGSAPTPFSLFLASLGACAGIYVLGFCRQRGLPTDGIRIIQRMEPDAATRLIGKVSLEIQVPPAFPEKYKDALIRSAEQCTVKKHLEHPPAITVSTVVTQTA
jgi:putative redox protein